MRAAIVAMLLAVSTSGQNAVFDGSFWMKASQSERDAFIDGYLAYHRAERLRPTLPLASLYDFEQAVTTHSFSGSR